MHKLAALMILCAIVFSAGCGAPHEEGPVVVLAAASLTDVLTELARKYENAHPGVVIQCSFTGSGEAASQILAGAPADLFFSADARSMDRLEAQGLLAADSRRDLIQNRLVVVAPQGASIAISGASDIASDAIQRIAIGGPSAPAGEYARQWLSASGVLDAVASRLVPFDNVRAALAAVETGQADLGLVYATDVQSSIAAVVAYEIPPAQQPRIVYPSATLGASPRKGVAAEFVGYVYSPWGLKIWRQHGFTLLQASETP